MRTSHQTGERLDLMVSRMVERAERSLCNGYNPPYALLRFAHNLSSQGHKVHAFRTGRKALSLAPSDPELGVRVRALLGSIAPGYHLTMVNDSVRNQAWDRALRATVQPGMRVLEIGSGPGLVALMAARAGASRVTTCEFNPVVAAVAREIIAHNGYADRIDVIAKSSFDLQVGVDLEAPADLFFCDNFSDNMFSFEPLKSIADARARLVKRGAPSLPSSAAVRVALADWSTDARFFRPGTSVGFDMTPALSFVPDAVDLEIGDVGMTLMSDERDIFRFDFGLDTFENQGRNQIALKAAGDGVINGIAQWIRLELTADIVLEARPAAGTMFFSNPRFYPLSEPRRVRRGETIHVTAQHDGRNLLLWAG